MNKILKAMAAAMLLLVMGCKMFETGDMNDGDAVLLSQDLRDLGREGIIYALTENPEFRPHVILVRDQLVKQSADPNLTINSMLTTLQGLPINELKSGQSRLVITAVSIALRRSGPNVDLAKVNQLGPLAEGLAAGFAEGLNYPIPASLQRKP